MARRSPAGSRPSPPSPWRSSCAPARTSAHQVRTAATHLLRNTLYFHGHSISQALAILLIYAVVVAVAISLPGWFRSPQIPISLETQTDAAAMATPAGAAP
jgi:hypothetical protein